MKTIRLTQGKVAIVDDDLFAELNKFKWTVLKGHKTYYAYRKGSKHEGCKNIYMHREIFRLRGETIPRLVDHRDRDGLHNWWDNLRPASMSESNRNQSRKKSNTSGFIGVSKENDSWLATVRQQDGRKIRLGHFDDPFSAAWVRDQYIKAHFPEFGITNNLCDRRRKSVLVKLERRKC